MITLAADLVLKASFILAVAAVLDRGLRRRASAATRHFAWTVALAALLALPAASLMLPGWTLRIPVGPQTSISPRDVNASALPRATATPSPTFIAPAPLAGADSPASSRRSFDPIAFAFALYSAGVAILLARLLTDRFALRRLAARAEAVENADWLALVDAGARQLRIRRPVRLLEADEDVMPFTFGTRQPTIVLPCAAEQWSETRRHAVILHELAHVARADCLAQHLAALACALYWPHPGVWLAARRLRVEREFACDDRVLTAGTVPREYAGHLLEIAHAFRGSPAPATALGMARARQLEHRLLAIIDDGRNRDGLGRGTAVVGLTAAAVLLVPMASLRAQIAPASVVDVSPIERSSAAAPSEAQDQDKSRDRFTQEDFSGTWELRPTREAGMVQVELRTRHSEHGTTVPLSRFEALNGPGATAAVRDGRIVDGTVHFANRRDAGTFTFDGVCRNQMCGGTYNYEPDSTFPSRLARYGIGAPTASEQYELAMEDVGVAYLEGLKAEGYSVPDVHTLVRAAEHGVSLDYVKAMAGLGYKLGTLDPLIRMRDHGVDPDYVKGMAAQGFTKLGADELVRLRDHGVDPDYAKGMRDLGYSADVTELVKARDHGVDPEFARGVTSLGYKDVPLDTLIRMRDHGVDPKFVRGLSDVGYKNVEIDLLVRMRDHGVDPDYARELAELGYKDLPPDTLIRMRDHGVDADFIRRVQKRVGGHPDVDDLIRRRDHGYDGR